MEKKSTIELPEIQISYLLVTADLPLQCKLFAKHLFPLHPFHNATKDYTKCTLVIRINIYRYESN
jgi:hypothetical protein